MPAYVFNDNLQSYSPGSGYPNGFFGNGVIFQNEFISGSASPTPSPVGFFENTGIYFAFAGDTLTYPVDTSLGGGTSQTSVAWWGFGKDPQFAPGGLTLVSASPVSPYPGVTLLTVQFETDNSISVIAPGAQSINSLIQAFDYFTWTFFSVTASFGQTLVGSIEVVTVTVSVYVNGVPLISGVTLVTNYPVASLWNGSPGINQWNFITAIYGYLAGTTDLQALPFYPAPVSPITAKAPQLIAEFANLPNPPYAWTPQLIVEIIIAGFVQAGGVFPEYIKARARPGH
jgi:hypothetical protein